MWLTVLVMAAYYAGCHQSPPNILADLKDPIVVTAPPDSGDNGCRSQTQDGPGGFFNRVFAPPSDEDYDVFSVLFRLGAVVNDVSPSRDEHSQGLPINLDPPGTQECKKGNFGLENSHDTTSKQYFARVCLVATVMPTILLFSSLIPSFYTSGYHGVCHWKLLNTVMSWGVLSGACLLLMSNRGMVHFSSVLSTHLSAHCMLSVCRGIHALDGGGALMVLPSLGIVSMSVGIALLCWGVTVTSPLSASTSASQFYLYHLGSIVVVDTVRTPMWRLSSIAGAQGSTVFCHSWDI